MKIFRTLCAAAVMALAALTVSCSPKTTEKATDEATDKVAEAAAATTEGVVVLTDDNMFRPDTKVSAVTVLDFNAVWCGPCKMLTPAFHKAAEEFAGKANFYSVDVDNCPATAQAFEAQFIPMVVILKPNGMMEKFVGLDPYLESENQMEGVNSLEEAGAVLYPGLAKVITEAL